MTTRQIEELREIGHRAHLHMAQLACLSVFECDDLDDEPSAFREIPDRLAFEINDTLGAIRDLAKILTERSTPESEEEAREVLARLSEARDPVAFAINSAWNERGEVPFPLYQHEAEALADAALSVVHATLSASRGEGSTTTDPESAG